MKIVIGPKTFSNLSLPLSFIIPALVRMIPELQFPYPIGFDTPSYLAQAEVYAKNMLLFPLPFSLSLPDRWIYLLSFPFIFYIANFIENSNILSKGRKGLAACLCIIIGINFP